MPLCRKIIRLGYLLGIPLIVIALLFPHVVMGIYTPDRQLVQLAFWPFVVMLSNYILSLPAHVFCNAVSGTGAPVRHLSTNVSRSPYTLFTSPASTESERSL